MSCNAPFFGLVFSSRCSIHRPTHDPPQKDRQMASASDFPTESREVKFEHSPDFVNILRETGVSLLVSTYQAGKLVVLGTNDQGLAISLLFGLASSTLPQ